MTEKLQPGSKIFSRIINLALIAVLSPIFFASSLTPANAITLVTISGTITKGGVAEAGATVALNQCSISGVEGGNTSITNASGFYSIEVPAGCTGQLSISTRPRF